ncbi:flagellar biosynthesis protein FlgL [Bradyrhizobium prioriisuperbiae]|uniref:flagellar biosynthesis protein FlgL n=1 Tax=Bradyrhizobium prioriisuperbiae TaxID=2854389 RepID=UPI0028E72110|nr:flagellar biosynthesis protein FlgL [Bradyrhizobium prioritasuperba]
MTVSGVGFRTSFLSTRILDLQSQFDDLQAQLATGKKSDNYAGMGVNRGFAIALRAQISSIDSFADTMTNVTTRINVANAALTRISTIGTTVQGAATSSSTQITSNGQTIAQAQARSSLDEMLNLLNSRSGDRYLFSGRATDTAAVASTDDIMNGVGAQAGLKQLINERKQADVGTGTGRLTQATPTPTSISLTEDAGPFGLKLASVTSSAGSVTVSGPTGSPATESIDLGATNLNNGDTITFAFKLPDGSSENVQLTATTTAPPQTGQFLIGANSTATAANLNAALTTGVSNLANGALVAASAMKASSEFFSGNPVPRVTGPSFATATTQTPGTSANTLSWYTGETGTDSARGTATARIDDGISVQYGARANEQAFTNQLQTIAAMAAMSTVTGDPNANAQITGLYQRVSTKLLPQTGQQSVQDIAADLAGAQVSMKSAGDRQAQTKNTAQTMLQSIEGVTDAEVSAKLLAVQNSLNASYQTTAMLYQTTLLKYL